MARHASGKRAWGLSDRSGFRYRLAEMLVEWNGLKVGPDEYEEKHPQLNPRRIGPDPQALLQPRPDTATEVAGQVLLVMNPFQSGSAGSSVITVFEPSHGRSTANVVIFRKTQAFDGFSTTVLNKAAGYTITVVDVNSYTITVIGETATIGGIRGGGGVATAAAGVATTSSTFDSISVTFDSASETFDEA